jgi:hypothetical protein
VCAGRAATTCSCNWRRTQKSTGREDATAAKSVKGKTDFHAVESVLSQKGLSPDGRTVAPRPHLVRAPRGRWRIDQAREDQDGSEAYPAMGAVVGPTIALSSPVSNCPLDNTRLASYTLVIARHTFIILTTTSPSNSPTAIQGVLAMRRWLGEVTKFSLKSHQHRSSNDFISQTKSTRGPSSTICIGSARVGRRAHRAHLTGRHVGVQ